MSQCPTPSLFLLVLYLFDWPLSLACPWVSALRVSDPCLCLCPTESPRPPVFVASPSGSLSPHTCSLTSFLFVSFPPSLLPSLPRLLLPSFLLSILWVSIPPLSLSPSSESLSPSFCVSVALLWDTHCPAVLQSVPVSGSLSLSGSSSLHPIKSSIPARTVGCVTAESCRSGACPADQGGSFPSPPRP